MGTVGGHLKKKKHWVLLVDMCGDMFSSWGTFDGFPPLLPQDSRSEHTKGEQISQSERRLGKEDRILKESILKESRAENERGD